MPLMSFESILSGVLAKAFSPVTARLFSLIMALSAESGIVSGEPMIRWLDCFHSMLESLFLELDGMTKSHFQKSL